MAGIPINRLVSTLQYSANRHIDPEALLLHAGIVESKQIQHQGWVEHFRAEAVFFHFLDSRVGIPSTGVMLESLAHFVGRKEWSISAVFFRNAFLPRSTVLLRENPMK